MRRSVLWFASLWLISTGVQTAGAQPLQPREEAADAWVVQVLREEAWIDTYLRYLGAPSNVLLGGFLLAAPPLAELDAAPAAAFMGSGGFFLTSAIGTWAMPDPHATLRWNTIWSGLGFAALGSGLMISCAPSSEVDGFCGKSRVARHVEFGIGAVSTGLFLSVVVLELVDPMPSPAELAASVRGRTPAERHDRVLAFLQARERRRRIGVYVGTPWCLALGGVFLGYAHEGPTAGGRTLLYGAGAAMVGLTVGVFVYELLRTRDDELLLAGRGPD